MVCDNLHPMTDTSDQPQSEIGSRQDTLQSGIGFRLSRATRKLRSAWTAELAGVGVSPPQAAVLRALSGYPSSGIRAVARLLETDPMHVKHLVDQLEGRGLISSSLQKHDRRTRALQLTSQGEILAREVASRVRDQQEWFASVLGPEGKNIFESALANLEIALEISGNDASDD